MVGGARRLHGPRRATRGAPGLTLRVAFDAAPLSLSRAGERRYASALLGALARRDDVSVVPITLTRRAPRSLVQRVAYQAAAEGIYYPLLVGRRVRRAGASLVHYPRHLVTPEIGLDVPAVVTLADVISFTNPELYSRVITEHQRLVTPGAARRAARLITHSEHAKSEIVQVLGIDADRIAVIPHGVDPRFRPVEPDRERLARRFGITGTYVLCVGTLEPRKNLTTVVAAMRRLHGSFPDHVLVMVGGAGWKGGELDAALRESGLRTITTGYVGDEELVELYAGAACFAFPSLLEGFGMPLLEAMACGTPVLTSDRSSLPEVAGDAAVLVDPTSADAVADGLASVLGSGERASELRRRGLERSAAFTWERAADETIAVYREALATIPRQRDSTRRRAFSPEAGSPAGPS